MSDDLLLRLERAIAENQLLRIQRNALAVDRELIREELRQRLQVAVDLRAMTEDATACVGDKA